MEAGDIVNNSPQTCEGCGGSNFRLLSSGKYKCVHCGKELLPAEIRTEVVSYSDSFSFKKILKRNLFRIILIASAALVIIYSTYLYVSSKNSVYLLETGWEEIQIQIDRANQIIELNKKTLKQKYNFEVLNQENGLEELSAMLALKEDDEFALSLLDQINGSINRITVAKRRFKEQTAKYNCNKTWLSEKLLKEKEWFKSLSTSKVLDEE